MGVMAFLIIMLVGSLASTCLILAKIDRTGQVNFFGVRFPF
jgi:hypothetical protein